MKIETELEFTIEKCRENLNKLYVFGCNRSDRNGRYSGSGQAIIRPEPNSFGISSKYDCFYSYSDRELVRNKQYIDEEIEQLLIVSELYDAIVFPKMGIGTGLAQLQTQAPYSFIYLCTKLLDVFKFNNMSYLKSQ